MSKQIDSTLADHPVDGARRDFIKQSAATAGAALASGALLYTGEASAKPADEAVSSAQRWGILVDTTKCADGCNDCVTACATENGWGNVEHEPRPKTDAQWIRSVTIRNKQTSAEHTLPLMCQHCENPPCADVCPTGASFRREDGIVLVDKHICIGCRYCMMACPYKARSFVHETIENQIDHAPRGKGTVESCTMCVHRVDNDRDPACVEACSHKALTFGDLKDPNSDIAKQMKQHATKELRADLGLNTGVRYKGL
ncbi:MAG: 4Fe-4S dicluster domain-containing protein [Gammaproteobacteria bacterium]|nr:4Fe-4S dicluster domain-containing protein [Gammaproteobacteria bacterium]